MGWETGYYLKIAICSIVHRLLILERDKYLKGEAENEQILSAHLKEATEEEKERLFCFIRQNIR